MIFYTAENFTADLKVKTIPRSHARYGKREYNIWHAMKQRCLNPNNPSYFNYGGRGIGICEDWLTFQGFFKDMGESPQKKEMDRIDNNLGYCKENCRWTSRTINSFNKRTVNKTGLPRGVRFGRNKTDYHSHISINNKQYYLGSFKTIEDAQNAYFRICKEWFGFIPST